MTTALQIARSGLDALDHRMKTISNNLANVSTTGFKRIVQLEVWKFGFGIVSHSGIPT